MQIKTHPQFKVQKIASSKANYKREHKANNTDKQFSNCKEQSPQWNTFQKLSREALKRNKNGGRIAANIYSQRIERVKFYNEKA